MSRVRRLKRFLENHSTRPIAMNSAIRVASGNWTFRADAESTRKTYQFPSAFSGKSRRRYFHPWAGTLRPFKVVCIGSAPRRSHILPLLEQKVVVVPVESRVLIRSLTRKLRTHN